jgi:membrane protein implicated in regulation of membrane protease activity
MLGEFVVRVANLVEAEGRAARRGAAEFLLIACAYLAAALLAVTSLVALAAAVFRGLVDGLNVPPGWAYLISSILLGLLAGAAALLGHTWLRRQRRTNT